MDQLGSNMSLNQETAATTPMVDVVIGINRQSVFSLAEAQELLPIVFRITRTYSAKVQNLLGRIDAMAGARESVIQSLESQVNQLIQDWQNKVQKLGAHPKGLWIADFDSGEGYFCWKYPERKIEYWHKYSDGYSNRVKLDANVSCRPG
jgi:hypothetical protein